MSSDIYYKDVQLFKTQSIVDKVSSMNLDSTADQQIVDDLVASAGLKRQDFYVVSSHTCFVCQAENQCAASKGLVASANMRIYLKTGDELSLSATNVISLVVPALELIDRQA
jgi:meiotic recombination protein SPO11